MIVCLGDILLDIVLRRDRPRGPTGTVPALNVEPGGSAANVASWLAYLDAPSAVIGAVGTDLVGDMLLESLRRHHVDPLVSRIAGVRTGVLLLETVEDGSMHPMAERGANDNWRLEQHQQEALLGARWLHLAAYAFYAEGSRQSVLDAVGIARAIGARVSLDLGAAHLVHAVGADRYRALLDAVQADVVLANEQEAQWLARTGNEALEELATIAPLAVLKRGAAGCLVREGNWRSMLPATPAQEIDPTGAGDAFAAGLIDALFRSRGIQEAAQAGVDLAARCVGMIGGQPPLIPIRETNRISSE